MLGLWYHDIWFAIKNIVVTLNLWLGFSIRLSKVYIFLWFPEVKKIFAYRFEVWYMIYGKYILKFVEIYKITSETYPIRSMYYKIL